MVSIWCDSALGGRFLDKQRHYALIRNDSKNLYNAPKKENFSLLRKVNIRGVIPCILKL